ncbi:MAG: hypothetical protein ACYTBP_13990, partial [Planctomycetota bacterium]
KNIYSPDHLFCVGKKSISIFTPYYSLFEAKLLQVFFIFVHTWHNLYDWQDIRVVSPLDFLDMSKEQD